MSVDMLGGLSGIAVNVVLIILALIVIGAIIWGIVYLFLRWRRYSEFECRIWGRDGFGNMTETIDRAGVFVDNVTKNKRLFLKKNNVGLDPDRIPYVNNPRQGFNTPPKIIYLLRTGLKNFAYIKPVVHNQEVDLKVGEEDVNWAVNAYEKQKKMFQNPQLMQIIAFVFLAVVCIVILVLFIQLFKKFDIMAQIAASFDHAAQVMAEANKATVVSG